jgi:hypothetical protein
VALALAGCAALAGCEDVEAAQREPPRRAADFRSESVDEALEQADRKVRTRGFGPQGKAERGFLVDRDSAVVDAAMRAGNCYIVLGASSSALRELDLRVYDADGAEVARDDQTGGHAAVEFCPAQSGTYYVAARAAAGSGLYALRRYQGPTGLDVRIDDLFEEPVERP